MNESERKRWERNARKAETFLVGCLNNPDVSYVQRLKAADIILARYYGRPALGDSPDPRGHDVNITFSDGEAFAL